MTNAPWPPDPDEVRRHDERADPAREAAGLEFTRKETCGKCGTINGHRKGCEG